MKGCPYRTEKQVIQMVKINEVKKKIVIDNYFPTMCDVNTGIKEAFVKGFDLGLLKAPKTVNRPKGNWMERLEPGDEHIYCDQCKERYKERYYEVNLYLGGNDLPNFCPNCGADMRGEENDKQESEE